MKNERYFELDFLRFLAALAVLFFHYSFRMWNMDGGGDIEYPILSVFSKYGYLGVDVFFIISGFVILMSAEGRTPNQFLISRFVRLFPAYWFCVIMLFFFAILWPVSPYEVSIFDFLVNLTMLQNLFGLPHVSGVFWTIVIEVHFYFFVYLIIRTNQLNKLNYILFFWLSLSISCDYGLFPDVVNKLVISGWSHYFIAGSIFYLIRTKGLSLFKLLMLALCFWEALRHGYWYVSSKEILSGVEYEPIVVMLFLGATFLFFTFVSLNKIPGNYSRLAKLGVLTYPLYLIHGLIGQTLLRDGILYFDKYLLLITVSMLMVIVSYLIQKFIERKYAPILKKKLIQIF